MCIGQTLVAGGSGPGDTGEPTGLLTKALYGLYASGCAATSTSADAGQFQPAERLPQLPGPARLTEGLPEPEALAAVDDQVVEGDVLALRREEEGDRVGDIRRLPDPAVEDG